MSIKIISDSSSDVLNINDIPYSSVPLKIITSEKEYVDDASLDVNAMISDLADYKGTSRTSCPNSEEWKNAFENYDDVFCVTITSGLSGSYNAACVAAQEHLEKNPGKRVAVLDSLSTGPENALIIEKLQELIKEKFTFSEIESKIRNYMKKTRLVFSLESMKNLANNGRVSKPVAKITGILGIRVIGIASAVGTLEVTDKVRGAAKTLNVMFNNMIKYGYKGGKVRIHHCQNDSAAKSLKESIMEKFPQASVLIHKTGALCSFYAESGGMLVGFES